MISIIIPVYNASPYLAECLNSIRRQTYSDWEAILVDDGSTDESFKICNAFASKDSRFSVLHQKNSGVSVARNTGLQMARGKWITFVDADDSLPVNALSTLLDHLNEGDFDLIIGGYEIFDSNDIRTYWIDERLTRFLDRDSAISLMYEPLFYKYLGYIWGKVFKTQLIRDNGLQFNPRISFNEDRLFVTQYLARCSNCLFDTTPVYNYLENPNSAMASLNVRFNEKFITDLDAMILMKETVNTYSKRNSRKAVEGIAHSYWRIQSMMNSFHANTTKRLLSLHSKLLRNLSLKDYCGLIIGTFFKKIYRRLAHA